MSDSKRLTAIIPLLFLVHLAGASVCNTASAQCNLTAAEAQARYLSTYEDLQNELTVLTETFAATFASSQPKNKIPKGVRMQAGPLIKNGNNGGILDIDTVMVGDVCNPATGANCSVCGPNTAMTTPLREAMVCSVMNDPQGFPRRGNTDAATIGFSTQGRALLAVRIGTPGASERLLLMSQIHGNEPAATEAFLPVLKDLVRGRHKKLLKTTDMLFILRANPDGGEPTADNLADDYPLYLSGAKTFSDNAYFLRQNVDPRAGGGFGAVDGNSDSEPGFFGVVGRGYDLNRYGYADFSEAIRPVESQALVAAGYVFKPTAVYDGHGDVQKTSCIPDPTTLVPGALLGVLPSVNCTAPADPIPTLLTDRASMLEISLFGEGSNPATDAKSQSVAFYMYKKMRNKLEGEVRRFGQISFGVGSTGNGLVRSQIAKVNNGYSFLVEVPNFGLDIRPAPIGFADGSPVINLDLPLIEPCFLADNICIHETAINKFLKGVLKSKVNGKTRERYCGIPLGFGNVGALPVELGWPPQFAADVAVIPAAFGVPFQAGDACPVP